MKFITVNKNGKTIYRGNYELFERGENCVVPVSIRKDIKYMVNDDRFDCGGKIERVSGNGKSVYVFNMIDVKL